MTAMYSSGPLSKYRAAPRRSGNSRWGEVCKEKLWSSWGPALLPSWALICVCNSFGEASFPNHTLLSL